MKQTLETLIRHKVLILLHASNKGLDQPAHSRSLNSAFCYSPSWKYISITCFMLNFGVLASLCGGEGWYVQEFFYIF